VAPACSKYKPFLKAGLVFVDLLLRDNKEKRVGQPGKENHQKYPTEFRTAL
jgi:hypothetical protein